jgi:hypothetical protein
MTPQVLPLSDTEYVRRWRKWQAKCVESNRRRTKIMRGVLAVLVTALGIWLLVLFA